MKPDYPSADQYPQLRRLWHLAFGDSDDFLDLFYSTGFSPDRCRCITEDGLVTAALYWFDCQCADQRFAYLYAVATHPGHRNQGLCAALMADARQLLQDLGYHGILLVPQTEQLAAMYRKLGYEDCTTVTEFTAPAEDTPLLLRRLNREEYARLRRELLPPGGVLQERENLDFLSAQALFFTGASWLAAVTVDGSKLRCHELLGDPDVSYPLVAALGCREGFFRIPGPDRPFAQYLPLQNNCRKPAYFGLAFD